MSKGISILLIGGHPDFCGRRMIVSQLSDRQLIRLPGERVILCYDRDTDAELHYYYNRKMSAALSANFDQIGKTKLKFAPLDWISKERQGPQRGEDESEDQGIHRRPNEGDTGV